MNAVARKWEWSRGEDLAGRYATKTDQERPGAWKPAANEVATRDYAAEALEVGDLVEDFVAELDQEAAAPDIGTRPPKLPDIAGELAAPPVAIMPDNQQAYFMSTQEWDGYVTDVGDDQFDAVIYPVGGDATFRQDTVSVPLWLVDEDARHRVRPGAIFRMATGRQRRKRQMMHGVRIYFRLAMDVRKQEGLDRGALEAFFAD